MIAHSTHFEATGGNVALTNAILLYSAQPARASASHSGPRRNEAAFASIHAIEEDAEGRPTIAAGVPLLRAHLRQWTEALSRSAPPEMLPANVLVAHPDMLAWWIPEQVRTGFFNLSSPPAGLRALSQQTTAPVPYPAHLFIATRSHLGVYALPANERPTADTPVLHSPILNVFADGKLCWGNISMPGALTIASIPDYERAVFDSWSTHPNQGQELTVTGKGGLVRLWDDLAARRATRFPVKRLKPFYPGLRRRGAHPSRTAQPVTVERLIAASSRR